MNPIKLHRERRVQSNGRMRPVVLTILFVSLIAGVVGAETSLTVDQVRSLALKSNRGYLSAQQDVAKARAEIVRVRADALPQLDLFSSYNRSFKIPKVYFVADGQTTELQTGFKNSFSTSLTLRQPIWQGGKVMTAWQIARLYKRYADARAHQVRAEVEYSGEQLFYSAILARSTLSVLQRAFEADSANVDVVQKLNSQGMVSDFEVLRAKVEMQNILPELIQAESEVRLVDKRLKSFLGIDLKEPIVLVEDHSDTSLTGLRPLDELTDSALSRRPENVQAQHLIDISRKAIRVAKGDYWPSLDAIASYDWSSASDEFTISKNKSTSWTAGLTLSFPIFSGGRTQGAVANARADHEQALLNSRQTVDDITLEVEEAYDRILQAKKSLDIQGTTIASAEEGFRIARLRYESGIGTQLEVLSAQSALTDARRILATALFQFRMARAGLKKATTFDTNMDWQ